MGSSCGALQFKLPTQAEKASQNQGAKVTEPGGPFSGLQLSSRKAESKDQAVWKGIKGLPFPARLKQVIETGKKSKVRRAPQSTADPVPERKRTTPLNPALMIRRIFRGVSRRPFRDRVIHLLALRNYKKPELLARLQRDGVQQKDRDCLGEILQQVANLNAKDNSFSLKEHLFPEIQKDWPGYSEIDRQDLETILSRKAALSPNATSTRHLPFPGPSDQGAPSRTQQKRPLDSTFACPVMRKKQRIGLLASRDQTVQASGLVGASSGQPPPVLPARSPSESLSFTFPKASEVQHKERPRIPFGIPEPARGHGVEETVPASTAPGLSGHQADYFMKYVAIVSYEQRQSYKDDFSAEYGEYLNLLAEINNITKKFRKFNAQRKSVTQKSKAYQMLCHQVLEEFQEIQQRSPSYSELKGRCQYLHNKLSHIKRLIGEFDQQQEECWHRLSASARTHP